MKKYIVVTGTRPLSEGASTAPDTEEAVGAEVDAENMTIEASGALTFWALVPGHSHRSYLVRAFARGAWLQVHEDISTVGPE